MSNHEPRNQEEQAVSYVEQQMADFANALRQTCAAADRLDPELRRAMLARVDAALAQQAAYEHAAGHEWLSPYYFSLADEIATLRETLASLTL